MTLRNRTLPETRRSLLKRHLARGRKLRIMEAHSGLSAIIASDAHFRGSGADHAFDGLWVSSLTASALRGVPDMELASFDRRLETIEEIAAVTCKPLIVDGDTGGEPVRFEYLCSTLEMMGVGAVIIEDKKVPKRNSLSGEAVQILEDPDRFAEKLARGCTARQSDDFLIFARLESLIAGANVADAVGRAKTYLAAGADGIMIHSKSKDPGEVFEFMKAYDSLCSGLPLRKPLIAVPTAYNQTASRELFSRGADIVIHANHMLRASVSAMERVCGSILKNDCSSEADNICSPVKHLFDLVGFNDVLARDRRKYYRVARPSDGPAAKSLVHN